MDTSGISSNQFIEILYNQYSGNELSCKIVDKKTTKPGKRAFLALDRISRAIHNKACLNNTVDDLKIKEIAQIVFDRYTESYNRPLNFLQRLMDKMSCKTTKMQKIQELYETIVNNVDAYQNHCDAARTFVNLVESDPSLSIKEFAVQNPCFKNFLTSKNDTFIDAPFLDLLKSFAPEDRKKAAEIFFKIKERHSSPKALQILSSFLENAPIEQKFSTLEAVDLLLSRTRRSFADLKDLYGQLKPTDQNEYIRASGAFFSKVFTNEPTWDYLKTIKTIHLGEAIDQQCSNVAKKIASGEVYIHNPLNNELTRSTVRSGYHFFVNFLEDIRSAGRVFFIQESPLILSAFFKNLYGKDLYPKKINVATCTQQNIFNFHCLQSIFKYKIMAPDYLVKLASLLVKLIKNSDSMNNARFEEIATALMKNISTITGLEACFSHIHKCIAYLKQTTKFNEHTKKFDGEGFLKQLPGLISSCSQLCESQPKKLEACMEHITGLAPLAKNKSSVSDGVRGITTFLNKWKEFSSIPNKDTMECAYKLFFSANGELDGNTLESYGNILRCLNDLTPEVRDASTKATALFITLLSSLKRLCQFQILLPILLKVLSEGKVQEKPYYTFTELHELESAMENDLLSMDKIESYGQLQWVRQRIELLFRIGQVTLKDTKQSLLPLISEAISCGHNIHAIRLALYKSNFILDDYKTKKKEEMPFPEVTRVEQVINFARNCLSLLSKMTEEEKGEFIEQYRALVFHDISMYYERLQLIHSLLQIADVEIRKKVIGFLLLILGPGFSCQGFLSYKEHFDEWVANPAFDKGNPKHSSASQLLKNSYMDPKFFEYAQSLIPLVVDLLKNNLQGDLKDICSISQCAEDSPTFSPSIALFDDVIVKIAHITQAIPFPSPITFSAVHTYGPLTVKYSEDYDSLRDRKIKEIFENRFKSISTYNWQQFQSKVKEIQQYDGIKDIKNFILKLLWGVTFKAILKESDDEVLNATLQTETV